MSPQQFLYKVWLPGQAPTSHEPTFTLHNAIAIKFFVESALHGIAPFSNQPFAVVAYYLANELMERPTAEGTYCLKPDEEPPLQVLYEYGSKTETGEGIIGATLKAACTPQEQVL